MKSDFPRTIGFFFSLYRVQTIIVAFLLILAGFAEAIGVAAFLPFLQIILDGTKNDGALPSGKMSDVFLTLGIAPTFPNVAALIVAAITLKAALQWIAMNKVSHTVAKVAADLRMRLMNSLLKADWRYFTTHTLGASLNAIATETFTGSLAFVSAARFISACIQLLIYAISGLIVSWVVFAGGTIIGGLIMLALWTLVKIARRAGSEQTQIAKQMLTQMADMLQGIKPVRAMALEPKFLDIMKEQSKGLQKAQSDQVTSSQSMRTFNEPLMVLAGVSCLYLAVTYGHLESSALILMGVLFMRILTNMNLVQWEYQRLASQESALWSLLDAIKLSEQAVQIWPGHGAVPANIGNIHIKNTSFSHGERPLLSDVDLLIPAGKFVALIGPSGSGKTSILDLICGFYRPDKGSIEISGTKLDDIDLIQWRQSIGFVPQEVFLFNDSVLENVRMGRAGITEDDVRRALDDAGATDFVSHMPEGIHSSVGENGRKLSGGQRQRIAIARAIIDKPKFLLLDEATSALDPVTEKNLLSTLKDLSKDISIIFVSHNVVIHSYADIVYEIDGGKILSRKAA